MDLQGPPPVDAPVPPTAAPDALRVHVAALAAQQIALDEAEIRLAERTARLDQQEVRLAELTANLPQAQLDILQAEKALATERQRLVALQRRLKQRWHRHWKRKQQQLQSVQHAQAAIAQTLTQRTQDVEAGETALRQQRLRLGSDAELARHQLREAWAKLKKAQFQWKHRRGLERSALRVRAHDVETAAQQVAQARSQLAEEQRAWQTQRQLLETELDGLNTRVENQRRLLKQQEAVSHETGEQHQPHLPEAALAPAGTTFSVGQAFAAVVVAGHEAPPVPPTTTSGDSGTSDTDATARIAALDRLADDLADQHRQLIEGWQRLAAIHQEWQDDRCRALEEVQALGRQLERREQHLQAREQAGDRTEDALRRRHEELSRLHEQIIGWRSQLRTAESAWETDKARLLDELRTKEAHAEQHVRGLLALRQRWGERRKEEIEQLERDRTELGAFRREVAKLRASLAERHGVLEEETRILAEKSLALEQHHAEMQTPGNDPEAQRHLERLRRGWLTQNADAIRQASREREALQAELRNLEQRHEALQARAAEVTAAEHALAEKQSAWEYEHLLAEQEQRRSKADQESADQERQFARQQLTTARDEVEHVIRDLLDQPEPPDVPLERAA